MGQIVKTKKKGRPPSKVDLTRRRDAAVDTPEKELRRSGRRRNVKYTFDFDDYLDDDEYFVEQDEEEEEEEDERGKEKKKLKHLLKLQQSKEEEVDDDTESTPSRTHRGPATSASSSSDDDEKKPSKKRKIEADYEQSEDELVNDNDNEVDEGRARNGEAKCVDSAPGTPLETPTGNRLPDKKKLDLIIDKLQKKDIYGVYAEPVDPEELPDYHEVIENPMDFATLRNKLANGSYSTLEQFESDVLLICSNAMQYNAPDTIYYKQARSIHGLAKKKFEKLRVNYECSEKDVKLDQKTKYGSVVRKQIKKTMVRMFQEPVGSDFSSGATLATARDNQILNSAAHAGALEKPCSVDGHAEGNASLIDHNFLDKAEESLPGKGPLSRFGRKASVHDENRRATYDLSTQPVSSTESIFSTFEDESKQLVTVGVYSDHAYARSLARFAASLGPVAWRVASQNIEQALPPGFKFGRGWVGEYEPLPTPLLMLENYTMKEPAFFSKFKHTFGAQKNEKTSEDRIAPKDKPLSRPILEGKSPYFGTTSDKPTESCLNISTKKQSPREVNIEGRPSFLTSVKKPPNHSYQHQTLQSRNFNESEKKLMKQVETNCPTLPNQRNSEINSHSQISSSAETPGSRSIQASPRNRSLLTSRSFKQPAMNGIAVAGLPNGKTVNNNSDITAMAKLASDGFPSMAKASDFFSGEQEHGLSDPVQLMRLLAEKAQNQQNSLKQSQIDASPISPATPSLKKDDSGNAAVAAARAWMSIGAGGFRQDGDTTNQPNSHISAESLYNPSRDVQQQILRFRGELPSAVHFQSNSSPLHAFASRPARVGNEAQLQYRPMIFPQLVSTDLSRFQVQSPWQSLNQPAQPRQKLESLPPDLNISFQSSGSPGQPSPGVLVDSQQPDLALQL